MSSEEQHPSDSPQQDTETTVNKVNDSICAKCGSRAVQFCQHCGQDFCQTHRCIMHDQGFKTESEPLVDDEGVTHQGRKIRLIGEGWPHELRMIKDMSDEEIVEQIKGLQMLLEDAIRTADYARICIAHREYELGYRENSRYVAAVKRREKLVQGSVKLNSKRFRPQGSVPIPPDVLALMKAFNLTQEQAQQLKLTLGGMAKQ